jgi:ABC-type Na+ transport system ATPase subunit NatA
MTPTFLVAVVTACWAAYRPSRANGEDQLMIEARGLTKRYESTVAVDDLSFDVRPGHVTGFLGPNGAGKTTTMRLILGLDRPNKGTVEVNGRSYADHRFPLHEVGALLERHRGVPDPMMGRAGLPAGKHHRQARTLRAEVDDRADEQHDRTHALEPRFRRAAPSALTSAQTGSGRSVR